jgi:hypothetical protein
VTFITFLQDLMAQVFQLTAMDGVAVSSVSVHGLLVPFRLLTSFLVRPRDSGLLTSGSTVVKMTIFPEWHSVRLASWDGLS